MLPSLNRTVQGFLQARAEPPDPRIAPVPQADHRGPFRRHSCQVVRGRVEPRGLNWRRTHYAVLALRAGLRAKVPLHPHLRSFTMKNVHMMLRLGKRVIERRGPWRRSRVERRPIVEPMESRALLSALQASIARSRRGPTRREDAGVPAGPHAGFPRGVPD